MFPNSEAIQLSIIIVNWNTRQLTTECIRSIQRHVGGLSYEIIIVDNGSTDGSQEAFRGLRGVCLIENQENVGFARANNIGMRIARGATFLLLNSDTLIQDASIEHCFNYLLDNPSLGMVGCKLLNSDQTLQRSCSRFPSLLTPLLGRRYLSGPLSRVVPGILRHGYAYSDPEHQMELHPDWIMGAFMMVRRSAVASAGMLDENYFMYSEDMDWCYRMQQACLLIGYLPTAAIVHLGGASSQQVFNATTVRRHLRGLFLFVKKHHPRRVLGFVATYHLSLLIEFIIRGVRLPFANGDNRRELLNCILTLRLYWQELSSVWRLHLLPVPRLPVATVAQQELSLTSRAMARSGSETTS